MSMKAKVRLGVDFFDSRGHLQRRGSVIELEGDREMLESFGEIVEAIKPTSGRVRRKVDLADDDES